MMVFGMLSLIVSLYSGNKITLRDLLGGCLVSKFEGGARNRLCNLRKPDIIYSFSIYIDIAAANPNARFDQRVASDVSQPPGSPTNQSWRYLFDAKEQNTTQKKF